MVLNGLGDPSEIERTRAELEASQDYVHQVLENGARKARGTASVVLDRVRRTVGLI